MGGGGDGKTELVFRGWDRGLAYPEEKARLESRLAETGNYWYAIFLIQLENGSRIGEAVNCFIAWQGNRKREQLVTVEKRKDKMQRRMIIPKVIIPLTWAGHMPKSYKDPKDIAATMCKRLLGYNSHALRHCRLSYWVFIDKKPEAVVAATVGMKSLGTIMNYMQRSRADDMLREAVE